MTEEITDVFLAITFRKSTISRIYNHLAQSIKGNEKDTPYRSSSLFTVDKINIDQKFNSLSKA